MLSAAESPLSGHLVSIRWSSPRLSAGNCAVYEARCVNKLALQHIGQFAHTANAMSSEGKDTRILDIACAWAKVVPPDKRQLKHS